MGGHQDHGKLRLQGAGPQSGAIDYKAVDTSTSSAFNLASAMVVLLLAAPAGAIITDQEPANDTIATAPILLSKTGAVTTAAGELVLVAGDIDFLGIAALSAGDIVTATTTPLDDSAFEVPDTIVGLFDSATIDLPA